MTAKTNVSKETEAALAKVAPQLHVHITWLNREPIDATVYPEAAPALDRPWTEDHQREALRCVLRILDSYAPSLNMERAEAAGAAFSVRAADVRSEEAFRAYLAALAPDIESDEAPLSIEAAVEHVRDLAEGRRVRDTVWRAVCATGPFGAYDERSTLGAAREASKGSVGARVVRVTRIRRAR